MPYSQLMNARMMATQRCKIFVVVVVVVVVVVFVVVFHTCRKYVNKESHVML